MGRSDPGQLAKFNARDPPGATALSTDLTNFPRGQRVDIGALEQPCWDVVAGVVRQII